VDNGINEMKIENQQQRFHSARCTTKAALCSKM